MAINQPRPHIMMGKAQAVPMRERTMREQVEAYLSRMRHTLPFPCSGTELYYGCVPAAVKQWDNEGFFDTETPLPGRAGNLLATMYASSEKTPAGAKTRHTILHVSVESQEEYLEAMRGSRGHEGIFWIDVPNNVPVPRNSTNTPFFLPEDHPFHKEINDWVEVAYNTEDEIQTSLELIERYSALVKTATQVKNTWPELMNFITYKNSGGLSNQVSHELRKKAAEVMRPTDKESLILQLTRAVMLPETSPPLKAWVKFYTPEIT